MNTLDIILLVFAAIGLVYGFVKGLVKQLTFGAGIAVGLLQAIVFYQRAGDWLHGLTGWENWICYPIGFMAILIAVAGVINLLGLFLRWLIKIVLLGIIDRILGALFSVFVGIVFVVFAVNISCVILPGNSITGETTQKESLLYKNVAGVTTTIIDEVKEEVKKEVDFD